MSSGKKVLGFFKIALLVLVVGLGHGECKSKPYVPNVPYKSTIRDGIMEEEVVCDDMLTPEEINEIKSYQDDITKIENLFDGDFKNVAYNHLKDLVDKYPIRYSGSNGLEEAIDYVLEDLKTAGLKAYGEQAMIPHWVRGEEKAVLLTPWEKRISILGLGSSVGTPEEGITADVLVVKTKEELEQRKAEAAGKIVVYNQGWLGTYAATNWYRSNGASHAAQYGAVAALVESVAPFSLYTPHTGVQDYWQNVTKIPVACISKEDAEVMARYQEESKSMRIHLKMADFNLPMTTSRNVIGEIEGSEKPNERVAVTGHIDAWDVGQGAMDDGGGAMISVAAVKALKHLGLVPRRSVQVILWTSEEVGLVGVEEYARQHENDLDDFSAVFESDSGTFKPVGLDFAGSMKSACIVQEVLKLTRFPQLKKFPSVSSDITVLIAKGVPGLSLNNLNDKYFWYHHTEADVLTMQEPKDMDEGAALFASVVYVLGSLENKLHRDPPTQP